MNFLNLGRVYLCLRLCVCVCVCGLRRLSRVCKSGDMGVAKHHRHHSAPQSSGRILSCDSSAHRLLPQILLAPLLLLPLPQSIQHRARARAAARLRLCRHARQTQTAEEVARSRRREGRRRRWRCCRCCRHTLKSVRQRLEPPREWRARHRRGNGSACRPLASQQRF